MRIVIVGSGAIGLYYGALLQQSGQEVCFLLRSDLDAAKEHGIRVARKEGELHLASPSVFGSTSEIGECDLVIVALKATSNESLASLLPPLLGERTRLLTLQNGLGNDGLLAELFPRNPVFGGLCFVCLNRVAPAVVENYLPGSVSIGPRDKADVDLAKELAELFRKAGVKTRLEEDLGFVQWKKLVWNVPFNGLTVVAGGVATDAVLGDAELLGEARSLMGEVIDAAVALGHSIDRSFIDYQVEITKPMGAYRPSSMIDFVEGRPVEVEAIWGEPLRMGRAAGVAMPKLEMLYALLKQLCR